MSNRSVRSVRHESVRTTQSAMQAWERLATREFAALTGRYLSELDSDYFAVYDDLYALFRQGHSPRLAASKIATRWAVGVYRSH